MISVNEARNIIDDHLGEFPEVRVPFDKLFGKVLAEDIVADRDFPPYNRAAMDGIAINWEDWQSGQRSFPVVGEQLAGQAQKKLSRGNCLEVMTGAVVPDGADMVIRYEDVQIEEGQASIDPQDSRQWVNTHMQGTDAKAGDILIKAGKRIGHGDIGILASIGKTEAKVRKLPRVAVISTGDELVDIEQTPLAHQVRKSNVHSLASLLKTDYLKFDYYHLDDDMENITSRLVQVLKEVDVVLLSGGVSKGKRDLIPEALEKLGVQKHFHRIKQRPGKPLWFGTKDQVAVFGFPGNPVSTMVCYAVYFRRWLNGSLGVPNRVIRAKLGGEIKFDKPLTYFMSVALQDGQIATSVINHGSGDLVSLSKADGFMELPADKSIFRSGEDYILHQF